MKKRNFEYINKKKAFRQMLRFSDLTSFLLAGFHTSRSLVVKKDILKMLLDLRQPQMQLARA